MLSEIKLSCKLKVTGSACCCSNKNNTHAFLKQVPNVYMRIYI